MSWPRTGRNPGAGEDGTGWRYAGRCLLLAALTLLGPVALAGSVDATKHAAAQLEAAHAMVGENWPANVETLPTTSGDIYKTNLDAQIAAVRPLSADPLAGQRSGLMAQRLATLLYHRFQLTGQLDDALEARQILAGLASQKPRNADFWLTQVRVLNGFHDFKAARGALDQAGNLGLNNESLIALRGEVETRLGERPLRAAPAPDSLPGDVASLVQSAGQAIDRGELLTASQLLKQAQDSYTGSSPFPLAWIHLQQGIAFLRHGDDAMAQRFFKAAHERLPQYYLATEHLAETELALGRAEEAARLYRLVIAQNDHPLFWYQLSVAQLELGLAEDAAHSRQVASEGYARLLAEYPALFADHAARYYQDSGQPEKALQLARSNLEHRRDEPAQRLLAELAMDAGDQALACRQARQIWQAGYQPPELAGLHCPPETAADNG